MMKLFRKYMKHMLIVFMSLLLVVWLGGSALQNVLRRQSMGRDEEAGVAFGEPVRLGDMQPAFNEANTLESLGIRWQIAWLYTLARWNVGDVRAQQQYAMQIRQERLGPDERHSADVAFPRAVLYDPGMHRADPLAPQRLVHDAPVGRHARAHHGAHEHTGF